MGWWASGDLAEAADATAHAGHPVVKYSSMAEHAGVDPGSEAAALGEVRARLAERFPAVSVELIEAAVRVSQAELTGQIRDFVPLLVEHAARDRLAHIDPDSENLSRLGGSTGGGTSNGHLRT